MPLPKFLQSVLWSYDLEKLDVKKDKSLIVTQILNYGLWRDIRWVCQNYHWNEIKEVIINPERGCWRKDSLNYWLEFFGIKFSKSKYKKALFTLEIK